MDLAEYFIDEQDEREWLPWGGIVRPTVVRNKDYSFFGVLSYHHRSSSVPPLALPKGWSIWTEEQHRGTETNFFLVISWNPFWSTLGDEAENTRTGRKIPRKKVPDYFAEELSRIAEMLRKGDSSCWVLEYQELLDFLSFSLSFGARYIEMPEVPLGLDVILTEGLDITFADNDLTIFHQPVVVLSLPTCPRGDLLDAIRNEFTDLPYRYVRRMLCMDKAEAEDQLREYTDGWCSGRAYMKRAIMDGIILSMSGYYNEQIIFSLPEESFASSLHDLRDFLHQLCIPYVLEDFNLKDVWWGSLAGCFRANLRPFVTGFDTLSEFLIQPAGERSDVNV
ncbi:MAG: hypothetical protein ACTTH3_04255 [Schwartzia sp. (in: firmicutes)]